MSVDGSVPTTVALAVLPSWNVTLIAFAPSTTCWFVTMSTGGVDDEARAFGLGALVAEAAGARVDDDVDDAR